MKKTRELKGMSVLALDEGERLGQVRELVLDPVARQVVALILDRRVGGEDQIVATANIRNVGPAAITVENRSSLVPLSRIPRLQELARAGKSIQGKVVISEAGVRLGQVDDLEVDVETFGVVSLVLKAFLRRGRVIPAALVRTIGTDAIVVHEEEAEPVLPPSATPLPAEEPPSIEELVAPSIEELVAPPVEEPVPFPIEEPAEPPAEAPASELVAAEGGPPGAEVLPADPDMPPAEPDAAPPSAEVLPVDPDLSPAEEGPGEEGEDNAWQRWVRRLKRGD